MAAALNLAVAIINSGCPMTDDQVTAVKRFQLVDDPVFESLTPIAEAVHKLKTEYVVGHPDEIRTVRTRNGTFQVNIRGMMDLADLASVGGFTIA